MKTIKMISMSLLIALFLMMGTAMQAQDPMKAGPKVYKKVLLNNDKVRVMKVEFAPGQIMPWHNHPHHTIYALTDGTLEITENLQQLLNLKQEMFCILRLLPIREKTLEKIP